MAEVPERKLSLGEELNKHRDRTTADFHFFGTRTTDKFEEGKTKNGSPVRIKVQQAVPHNRFR